MAYTEENERVLDQEKANKWMDATIPFSGSILYSFYDTRGVAQSASFPSTHRVSGAVLMIAGPLAYNQLHVIISKNAFHAVTSTNPLLTASNDNQYFPSEVPFYHIPRSGSSEYISVINHAATNVEMWISVVER